MSKKWLQEYTELTNFINNHPEIKLGSSVVRIPENVRSEFYGIFKSIRETMVREEYKDLLDRAEILSKNYTRVEKEIIKLMNLNKISTNIAIHRFLMDPIDQLIRVLFNPLFDLVKGRINTEKYEQEAARNLNASFDPFYQQGYEKWMTLSLIKLLKADKSYWVDVEEFNSEEFFKHGGPMDLKVPESEEIKELSIRHDEEIGLLVGEQIVHSTKIGQFFSFRADIVEALGKATNKSINQEWLPVPSVVELEPNVTLVYTNEKLEDISLIADIESICRPDMIIECISRMKMYNEDSLGRIKTYHDIFKPRLGTYIVTIEPVKEQFTDQQEADIHFLPVGYDQSKLEQIVNQFVSKEVNDR
jgi:hypothetical protein